ncbi:MAG: hypothetical protein GNW80_17215 [Asgard group archaeon]|nr:hypothetical protein [Asgard group archaeon]
MAKVDSIKSWQSNYIGGGQFLYKYARAQDEPLCSAWILVFHKNLVILGNTEPHCQQHTQPSP